MNSRNMPLGPVMVDVEGLELIAEERKRLLHPACGGVILFARNFASREQVAALAAEIHALRDPPLLVAVDQEGGRIQRFREGFTRLPPAAMLGRVYDADPQRGLALSEDAGFIMAAELRRANIDLSFAPVLDLAGVESDVIGDRAFHHRPEAVAALAGAFIRGMARAGMRATGKHFPGHGGVAADSHLETPVDSRDLEQILALDLAPFRALHQRLGGIMTAHIRFPRIDAELPTFSPFWLQEILRQKTGFQGLVFSDDLTMGGAAVAGDPPARANKALRAGCDMVLVCNDPDAAGQVLASVEENAPPPAQRRLLAMRGSEVEKLAETKRLAMIEELGTLI
ncbi:MAG: beta-N-acetylhexosaminidase [Pseudomonadota bacterium]|nr:beta-N-acetylhexosaminidase [Pseudomonadota bacterium]